MYYAGPSTQQFLQVVLAAPKLVPTLRNMLQSGISFQDPDTCTAVQLPCDVFEANIPFELRYMVDNAMVGCSWIEGD